MNADLAEQTRTERARITGLNRMDRSEELCRVQLVLLGGRQVHKLVKFCPRGMIDKRETEQAQLFETADERGCTPMFGTAHRRASAVPYPRRYEGPSLF